MTGIYNYTIDPYGILERRREFASMRPNEHSLKVHHVLQNPTKYNSFLFSNSKGGVLHFNQLNDEKNSWYNMTYSLGTPEEFYNDLILLLENNVQVKNLVVALDEGALYERTSSHRNQAGRKFVSMEGEKIQWEYLFLPISFQKIVGPDLGKKHIVYDIYKDGNYYEKNAYPDDCDSFEELTLVPMPQDEPKSQLDFTAQLKTLTQIRNLCNQRNISLTFLIHPNSYDNYKKSTRKIVQFKEFLGVLKKEGLVLLQPFKKSLLKNNSCYWLDRHHYSKKVGDTILQMYTEFKE